MSAITDAYDALMDDLALQAMVSGRVFSDWVPHERDMPAIAITRMGNTEFVTTIHSGVPLRSEVNLEITCHHITREDAIAVGDLAMQALGNAGFTMSDRFDDVDVEKGVYACVLMVVGLE